MLVLSISVEEAMIKKNSHIYSIKEDVCCYKSEKTINFVRTEATAGTAGQPVNYRTQAHNSNSRTVRTFLRFQALVGARKVVNVRVTIFPRQCNNSAITIFRLFTFLIFFPSSSIPLVSASKNYLINKILFKKRCVVPSRYNVKYLTTSKCTQFEGKQAQLAIKRGLLEFVIFSTSS